MPRHRCSLSSAERLERRDLLAEGAISATIVDGVLTLVGDDQRSLVTLKISAGAVTLTPSLDTSINGTPAGQAVTLSGSVEGLKADLKGGDDWLVSDDSVPLSLPKGVTVSLGSGDNVLELTSDVAPLVLGSVSVTAGIGFDRVEISGPAGGTASGALVMSLGDGGSTVALREITLGGSQVAVTTGVGNDSLEIVGLAGTAAVKVAAGLGRDDVTITGTTLGGMSLSAQQPDVVITSSTLAGVKVAGVFTTALAVEDSTITGGVSASSTATGGDVELTLDGFDVAGDVSATSKGAGSDVRLTLAGSDGLSISRAGNLLARAGGLNSTVTFTVATRSVVTFAEATSVVLQATASGGRVNATLHGRFEAAKAALTCSAAGQAGTVAVTNDGSLSAASATFAAWGDAVLTGGGGMTTTNDLRISSLRGSGRFTAGSALDARNVSVTAGRDAAFAFTGTAPNTDDVRGSLLVRGSRGADVLVGPGGLFKVLGSLTCQGGVVASLVSRNDSQVDVGGSCAVKGTIVTTALDGAGSRIGGEFTAAAAMIGTHSFTATSCIFAAKAAVSGGDGDDLFTVGPGVRFQDSLSVRLGNGDNGIDMEGGSGTTVAGSLSVTTGSGTDLITLVGIVVAGGSSFATGNGADDIAGNACTFVGNVTMSFGGGFDRLLLATEAGASRPVSFQGTLVADMGSEDDILLLGRSGDPFGGDANTRVVFDPDVLGSRINGGTGVNTFDRLFSNFTGLPPTAIVNFPGGPI